MHMKLNNRVPHCSECERCQCTDFIYKDYYCCEENDTMQIFGSLGVDHPPKTSPKWCPLRDKKNEQQQDCCFMVKFVLKILGMIEHVIKQSEVTKAKIRLSKTVSLKIIAITEQSK